ncbi:MAG TPA: DUF2127 domain-containing protein [Solirubrobacteraceae bacterium]|jgi:uncharacterized membrane protein (DUF2068 family)|nr:DUF2127 domain-containing protein [Solirubrobacteraceae bacterium]
MPPPGTTVQPSRYLPRFHWELLACGVAGHELVGTTAAHLREEDAIVAREMDGVRWHRCLRCDSWLALPPPEHPDSEYPPEREQIELPLRGRPLRDKIVLRIIAIDRAFHFLVLGLLAVAIFLFAGNQRALRDTFYRVVTDVQQGFGGGPVSNQQTGFIHELDKVFSLQGAQLHLLGAAVAAYALLELLEAVGLWLGKRWAEYLAFIATAVFLPLEVYELTKTVSVLKLLAFVINVAIVAYLLYAKRLFGLRGGARAEEEARERDVGWQALERTAPETVRVPA